MTPLRWTLVLFGTTVAIAVGAFAVAAATTHDDGSGTPEHTVRDFLINAVAQHDGLDACRYVTRRSLLELRAADPRGMSCEAAVSANAHLKLGGERVRTEAQVKALTYGAEGEASGRVRVMVSARGDSRTFILQRATQRELEEYDRPATPWRIASGLVELAGR